jgi:hypothetical protein
MTHVKAKSLMQTIVRKTPTEGLTQIGCRHPMNGEATAFRTEAALLCCGKLMRR